MEDIKQFTKNLFETLGEENRELRKQSEAALTAFLQDKFINDDSVILTKNIELKFLVDIVDTLEERYKELSHEEIYNLIKGECIKYNALIPFQAVSTWGKVRDERKWIINDWMPEGSIGMLVGQGGSGKSSLILQLASALSSGNKDWMQLHADQNEQIRQINRTNYKKPIKIVFCSYEDEIEEVDRRFQKISKTYEFATKINDNFYCIDCTNLGAIWKPSAQGSQHISTLASQTRAGDRIQKFCEKLGAKLLIIDPLAAAYGSEENSRALVRDFMTFWLSWARKNKCTVLFISHEPKNVHEDFKISGSTDWHSASRFVLHLGQVESRSLGINDKMIVELKGSRMTKAKGLKLTLIKSNYGRKDIGHWVRLLENQGGMVVCSEFDSCYYMELAKGNINKQEEINNDGGNYDEL